MIATLAVALLVTEMATAYSVRLTRPERFWRPDSGFLAMMKVIRETPGQAVFDWPFCVAGGNGIGTGKIGRFYGLQSGISVLQVYHGKKIVGNYFGRLHPDLIRPYLDAGWDSLFVPDSREFRTARVQRRDFFPSEWDFVEAFFKLNDFAGIVLYADLLPPETLATFHSRFGPPTAVARGEPYGRIEFIAKKPEWRALVDPVAGRNLRLKRRGAPWEPGRRVAFTDLVVQDYLGVGWGGANTEGQVAEVRFALDRIEPLYWSLRARPLGPQRVLVELNGHPLETVRLGGGEETFTQRLPVEWLERNNTIVLRLPDACSPKSMGLNSDLRILSLTASWMALQRHAMPAPSLDEPLAMDREDVEAFLGSGWGQGERKFGLRSTRGKAARIHFGLDKVEQLVVTLDAQTVGRQRVEFVLNGQSILATEGDGAWGRIDVALPPGLLRADNELLIRLPDARSPRSVGVGTDDRVLGLAVRTLEFRSASAGPAPPSGSPGGSDRNLRPGGSDSPGSPAGLPAHQRGQRLSP